MALTAFAQTGPFSFHPARITLWITRRPLRQASYLEDDQLPLRLIASGGDFRLDMLCERIK